MGKDGSSVLVCFEHHIFGHAHRAYKPHAESVFRYERKRNAEIAYLARRFADELFNTAVGRVVGYI